MVDSGDLISEYNCNGKGVCGKVGERDWGDKHVSSRLWSVFGLLWEHVCGQVTGFGLR